MNQGGGEIPEPPRRSLSTRWQRKKDTQVRRLVRRFEGLARLDDPRFRPALQSLARLTLLLERSYEHLKGRESLLNEKGELCTSVDVIRRLCESQASLLKMMGLTPTSVLPDQPDREIEAAYERITAMKRERGDGDVEPNGAA